MRIEATWFAVLVGHCIGLDHALAGADCADPADAALAVANRLLLDNEALFAVFAFHYSRRPVAKSRVDIIIPEIEWSRPGPCRHRRRSARRRSGRVP